MKTLRWAVLAWALLASFAAADWRDELTKEPGKFAPMRPLDAHFRFGWTMFTAGEADFAFSRARGGITQVKASGRTIGVVRSMWKMDVDHTARMKTATLRPLYAFQQESYKSEVEKTTLTFSETGVARYRESTPRKDKPKTKNFDFPDVFDLHSALHFIRSQELKNGDRYKIVVYPATTPYLAEVIVSGRQKLKAAGQVYDAIRLDLQLAKIDDETMALKPHEKFKRGHVFISDDADRLLLRVEAEIFVGAVWGEMERVELKK